MFLLMNKPFKCYDTNTAFYLQLAFWDSYFNNYKIYYELSET